MDVPSTVSFCTDRMSYSGVIICATIKKICYWTIVNFYSAATLIANFKIVPLRHGVEFRETCQKFSPLSSPSRRKNFAHGHCAF